MRHGHCVAVGLFFSPLSFDPLDVRFKFSFNSDVRIFKPNNAFVWLTWNTYCIFRNLSFRRSVAHEQE